MMGVEVELRLNEFNALSRSVYECNWERDYVVEIICD
jgi:hypothetical protein